jgi:hypothetical protein
MVREMPLHPTPSSQLAREPRTAAHVPTPMQLATPHAIQQPHLPPTLRSSAGVHLLCLWRTPTALTQSGAESQKPFAESSIERIERHHTRIITTATPTHGQRHAPSPHTIQPARKGAEDCGTCLCTHASCNNHICSQHCCWGGRKGQSPRNGCTQLVSQALSLKPVAPSHPPHCICSNNNNHMHATCVQAILVTSA